MGKKEQKGMDRRSFLRTLGVTAVGIGASALTTRLVSPTRAHSADSNCRIVVFGSDSLRIDYARLLRNQGAQGLESLSEPICVTSGGASVTQPGWAEVWSGLPSFKTGCYGNGTYTQMPLKYHIMRRLMDMYEGKDLYPVWVTGKGRNIDGTRGGPHHAVRKAIVGNGHLDGVYHGDKGRENQEVFELAYDALRLARQHHHFCCFVHFADPDDTGHRAIAESDPYDFQTYMNAASAVDQHIWDLMRELPPDTKIIYCSDHGFDFVSRGDCRNAHQFSPYGMVATNFHTISKTGVDRMAVGRLIYKAAGGDPDCCPLSGRSYRMFGEDLI